MKYPTYIEEAVKIVKFGFDTSRSVDGFLIKLESAFSHILEQGDENNIKLFLNILLEKGLLSKLACNKEDVQNILQSPRHALLKKHSVLLYKVLDKSPCIKGYKYIVPPPSKSAGHISWGIKYRDTEVPISKRRYPSLSPYIKKYLIYLILISVLILILYSGYMAYINLIGQGILNTKIRLLEQLNIRGLGNVDKCGHFPSPS